MRPHMLNNNHVNNHHDEGGQNNHPNGKGHSNVIINYIFLSISIYLSNVAEINSLLVIKIQNCFYTTYN